VSLIVLFIVIISLHLRGVHNELEGRHVGLGLHAEGIEIHHPLGQTPVAEIVLVLVVAQISLQHHVPALPVARPAALVAAQLFQVPHVQHPVRQGAPHTVPIFLSVCPPLRGGGKGERGEGGLVQVDLEEVEELCLYQSAAGPSRGRRRRGEGGQGLQEVREPEVDFT
jgi:hypothetical protein